MRGLEKRGEIDDRAEQSRAARFTHEGRVAGSGSSSGCLVVVIRAVRSLERDGACQREGRGVGEEREKNKRLSYGKTSHGDQGDRRHDTHLRSNA